MKTTATFKMLAYIREAECIGCAKCIQACPFDAIIGAPREMHTVIAAECIGCDLCIPACPVDCIDRIPVELSNKEQQNRLHHARNRHHARKQRLTNKNIRQNLHNTHDHAVKTNYVLEAIKRNKSKKQL